MLYVQQRLPTCVERVERLCHTTHTCAAAGHRRQGLPSRCHGRQLSVAPLQWAGALHNGQTCDKGPGTDCQPGYAPSSYRPQWLGCPHRPRRPHTADNSNSLSCYLLRCPLAPPHVAAPHTLHLQPPGCNCGWGACGLEPRGPTVNCLGGGRAEAARHATNHSVGKPHSP